MPPPPSARRQRIPDERLPTIELVPALARRHAMHGLIEVDVTEARRRIHAHRDATGTALSLTAFLIHCLARAVDEDRTVQALRRGRWVTVFDRVDVATLVEVDAAGTPVPLPHVVRDAAARPVAEITAEIRAVQVDGSLARRTRRSVRSLRFVPRPLRWVLWRLVSRSPRIRVRYGGTVAVTSVGMFGVGRGWGMGMVGYPVTLTVGGISTQPVLHDGSWEPRQMLCLTVSLDHEVVDGAPAARFVRRLRELVEAADGLDAPAA